MNPGFMMTVANRVGSLYQCAIHLRAYPKSPDALRYPCTCEMKYSRTILNFLFHRISYLCVVITSHYPQLFFYFSDRHQDYMFSGHYTSFG